MLLKHWSPSHLKFWLLLLQQPQLLPDFKGVMFYKQLIYPAVCSGFLLSALSFFLLIPPPPIYLHTHSFAYLSLSLFLQLGIFALPAGHLYRR
jgi:hypothetical protein